MDILSWQGWWEVTSCLVKTTTSTIRLCCISFHVCWWGLPKWELRRSEQPLPRALGVPSQRSFGDWLCGFSDITVQSCNLLSNPQWSICTMTQTIGTPSGILFGTINDQKELCRPLSKGTERVRSHGTQQIIDKHLRKTLQRNCWIMRRRPGISGLQSRA